MSPCVTVMTDDGRNPGRRPFATIWGFDTHAIQFVGYPEQAASFSTNPGKDLNHDPGWTLIEELTIRIKLVKFPPRPLDDDFAARGYLPVRLVAIAVSGTACRHHAFEYSSYVARPGAVSVCFDPEGIGLSHNQSAGATGPIRSAGHIAEDKFHVVVRAFSLEDDLLPRIHC
ncbi:MAG: hypothetical protein ABSB38_07765 [Dehalococcoidia bacterium]